MSTNTIEPVLHSFAYGLDYLREQVADVSADDMVALPPGTANHPAWVVGHLAFACQMLGGVLGLPEWLPAHWASRYGPGSAPVSNAAAYETKEHALAMLRDSQLRLTQAIEPLSDAQLDTPFPDPAYRDVFPTIRHALTQVLVGHAAFHIGQISVWRKAMGMPRMGRSFE